MARLAVFYSFIALFALLGLPAKAVQPDEILDDPALEERARELSLELRCLVCQNQSIDDSDAPLARDLRVLVRERLVEGDTNSQVLDFVVARYGEFVLLRPRFATHTLVLWLAPPILLLFGIAMLYRYFRRREAVPVMEKPSKLTAKEKRELSKLLKKS